MATFVPLREGDSAMDLVALLELITLTPEQRAAKRIEAEEREERLAADENAEDEEAARLAATPNGQLVTNGKFSQLLELGFFPKLPALLSSSTQDVNSGFSLAYAQLPKCTNLSIKELGVVVDTFVNALVKDTHQDAQFRLQLLTVLFNLLDTYTLLPAASRHPILLAIINLAISSGNSSMLRPAHFDALPVWIDEWELDPAAISALYKAVASLFDGSDRVAFQRFAYEQLRALQGARDFKGSSEHAVKLVTNALALLGDVSVTGPFTELDRLESLDAVKALSKKEKTAPLVRLLAVFVNGTIEDYLSFYDANKSFVDSLNGVTGDVLRQNIRTLTIAGLGLTRERLPYAQLLGALKLSTKEEVEEAVIDAVVSGRVFAKLDEANEEVVILRTSRRQFQQSDWKELSAKLTSWKAVIRKVMCAVDDVQHARAQSV